MQATAPAPVSLTPASTPHDVLFVIGDHSSPMTVTWAEIEKYLAIVRTRSYEEGIAHGKGIGHQEGYKAGFSSGHAHALRTVGMTKALLIDDEGAVTKADDVAAQQPTRLTSREKVGGTTRLVEWVPVGGIQVDADKLQYKDRDGAEDGLSKERRDEIPDQFNPHKTPPIALWRGQDNQIRVVDGHKRLACAKKCGYPVIRAFFIEAGTFEEAKKAGERLNEKMGTKALDWKDIITHEIARVAFIEWRPAHELLDEVETKGLDAKKHMHAEKGSSKGGQFVSKGDEGGTATLERGQLTKEQKKKKEEGQERREKAMTVREYAPKKQWQAAVEKAKEKGRVVPKPTKEEVKKAEEGMKKEAELRAKGINWRFRKTLDGNSDDRRGRREALLKEFGDGESCPCVYCGVKLYDETLEQDKIIITEKGGRYRKPNLVPACKGCNNNRKTKTFQTAIGKAKHGEQLSS